jgi:hypothetical protein
MGADFQLAKTADFEMAIDTWQVIKAGSGFKFIPPDRVIRARGPGLALGGVGGQKSIWRAWSAFCPPTPKDRALRGETQGRSRRRPES